MIVVPTAAHGFGGMGLEGFGNGLHQSPVAGILTKEVSDLDQNIIGDGMGLDFVDGRH